MAIVQTIDLSHIPGAGEAYLRLEGHEPVLHVHTYLPIDSGWSAVESEKLYAFDGAIREFMKEQAILTVKIHSKS